MREREKVERDREGGRGRRRDSKTDRKIHFLGKEWFLN